MAPLKTLETPKAICLVTGGTGLVGRGLQEVVESEPVPGWSFVFVGSKDADLTCPKATSALFDRVKPTHVLHLAAIVGGIVAHTKQKVEFFRLNLAMQDNVMHECHKRGVKKLVSCLSTCIFPDKTTYPIDETMLHNGPPHPSNEGYAYAKRMIDVLTRMYNTNYGVNYTSVILSNVFGKFDNFHLEDSHVAPCLIHKAYMAKQNGTPFTVLGSGRPLRQFVYNKDIGKLLLWSLKEYNEVDPLILCVDEDEEVSIGDLALAIADAVNFKGKILFDASGPDGQFKKTVSNAKMRTFLPDFKFTPFKDAIEETVKWFESNYDSIRK